MDPSDRKYSIKWLNDAVFSIKNRTGLTEEAISARLGYNGIKQFY